MSRLLHEEDIEAGFILNMGNRDEQLSAKGQLKAIFFCHPGLVPLLGARPPQNSVQLKQLNSGHAPQARDLSLSLVRTTIPISEVPTCFGSSPLEEPLPWHLYPGAQELGECVQYQFSDGTVLHAREIFYHPYCANVPLHLLPLIHQIVPEVQKEPWLYLLSGKELPFWGGLRQAELALISVLIRATSQETGVEVWLTDSTERETQRNALTLKKVGVIPSHSQFNWNLASSSETSPEHQGLACLSLKESPLSDGNQIFQNFEWNTTEHSLFFHSYFQLKETVCRILYPTLGMGKSFDEWTQEHTHIKTAEFIIPLRKHTLIKDLSNTLDLRLKAFNFGPISRKLLPESSEVENQIWIEKTGKIQFCRKLTTSKKPIFVWNLSRDAAPILQGLIAGLGSTTPREIKDLAQDRRGLKRDRDLKVLKHTGLFALVLLESSSYILEGKSFEGTPLPTLQDFLKLIYSKLGVLLYEFERKAGFVDLAPAPPLDKLCSKNVIDLIQHFVTHTLDVQQLRNESVFTNEGELHIPSGKRAALVLIHSLLCKITIESKGQCFLKPRLNAFFDFLGNENEASLMELSIESEIPSQENSKTIQSYNPVSNWITSSQVLHAFLPLYEKGFNLFYNGLPLNKMNTVDFKPVFELQETEEVSSEAGPSIDWFELHPKFFFKGVEIGTDQLDRLTKEGVLEFQGKVYLIQNKNLPSIKRLEAFWAKIQSGRLSDPKRKSSDRFLRLPRSQTLEMLALRASGIAVTGGTRWKKICEFYDTLDRKREPPLLPDTIHAELKPYQKMGVQWLLDLYDLGLGGILADDMGLGKTIQTLSFLETLRIRNEMGSTLIVVPTSLTYNWMSESAKFTPQMPVMIFQSKLKNETLQFFKKNKNAALICTYGLFTEHQEFFSEQKWNILIFDEAQNLKNISSKRTTASRKVQSRFKVCLTGTPLENHLGEFYSLLDLVVSGSLGELSTFREKFVIPETVNKTELSYLKLKTRPLVLRRTKAEILSELPPKQESTIKLPFELKQERIYRDIALSWNEKVKDSILADGESKSQLLMLTALLRLRQACSDPGSIPNIKYDGEPPKISVLLEALQEITESGESALVFTQFIHTFERIKRELGKNGIETYSLHGGTSRADRERVLQAFQESKNGSVLLMTLKTGGVGLNLIKASYVFHLEPWWNPAVENQATDRAHRIGQQRPVQVYRYLMRESVEEKIEVLKNRKSAKFNALFSSTEEDAEFNSGSNLLSQSDFEYLLS